MSNPHFDPNTLTTAWGERPPCPERPNGPHHLLPKKFGGAFCRRCDHPVPNFHMHYRTPCDCTRLGLGDTK